MIGVLLYGWFGLTFICWAACFLQAARESDKGIVDTDDSPE
jgi:hypothetical protein